MEPQKPRRQANKVISGNASYEREPTGSKFLKLLVNVDGDNIKDYLVYELLIPTIKDTLNNAIQRTSEIIFFGGSGRKGSSRRRDDEVWTSYGSASRDRGRQQKDTNVISADGGTASFDTLQDLNAAVRELNSFIDEYGNAQLADLYRTMGKTKYGFAANDVGWTHYISAKDYEYRNRKFILHLPPLEDLD